MRRITNSKKRNIYLWNQYDYYSDLPKLGSPRPGHQKIKLRSPNRRCNFYVAVGLQLCDYFCKTALTLSWRRPLSYRSQSIDLLRKLMDWFLYDTGIRHERVKSWWRLSVFSLISLFKSQFTKFSPISSRAFISSFKLSLTKNSVLSSS